MFKLIDSFLLGKTQWLCDRFTMLTGHTKFRLEVYVIVIGVILYWAFAAEFASIIMFVLAIIFTLVRFSFIYVIRDIEKGFLRYNRLPQSLDDAYPNHVWFRCVTLVIPILAFVLGIVVEFSLTYILLILWSVAFATDAYIFACMPLPPGKSKLKKWLVNMATKLKVLPQLPVPVSSSDS